jgi:16S rRNA (cytosine967-C5)-methyltransferase
LRPCDFALILLHNMQISPARIAAFEILSRIEKEEAFSSVLLPQYENDLSPQDRGLCHTLTLGILRKQIGLDRAIAVFSKGKKLDPAVKIALRIGLYQLLFLDKVPDYSAINESVNLVQYAKKTSAKGFVNAILRRATRESINFEFANDVEKISVETSHPQWLLEKWIAEFGKDEAFRLASANNDIGRSAFRLTSNGRWKDIEALEQLDKSEFVEGCYFAGSVDLGLKELAELGDIYFQDEASQMVAQAVGLAAGERFLDVCAAPGSKTTLIAERGMRNAELIVAGDLHWTRVKFLHENCLKQGVENVSIVQYDAEMALPFAAESFDVILLDVPCSGTGTIRHNPEIRYTLRSDDFAELADKQLRILENASKLVKPGGRLIYSTCSLEVEENEAVCAASLSANSDFRISRPDVAERFVTKDGFARTFPHRDSMDGFFLAVLTRI